MDSTQRGGALPHVWMAYALSLLAGGLVALFGERQWRSFLTTFLSASGIPLYTTLAQIAAALLGFVVTGVSIALVVAQDPKFRRFRESPNYTTLWRVFKASIWSLGLATVLAIASIFAHQRLWLLYANTAIFIFAALRLFEVIRTIFALTSALANITRSVEDENRQLEKSAQRAREE